ncbi:MAG: hypothetical protein J1E40_00030 [Oscillospiraceae bacterium]|nr:hypothetical protein [Oscillospiraceae bacterium]
MKYTSILTALILALALTSCANADTGSVNETGSNNEASTSFAAEDLTEEILNETSEAVPETETVSETEAETETAETTEAEISQEAELTFITETDSSGITFLKVPPETKYYECRFTDKNVITDPSEFKDQELLENAQKLVNDHKIVIEPTEFTEGGTYTYQGGFVSAITSDFNGDGQNESVFLFTYVPADEDDEVIFFTGMMLDRIVYADSSGKLSLIDEEFSYTSEIAELEYNGFSHLVVNGGHNNMSSKVCIYSVRPDGLKLEITDGSILGYSDCISDGFLLKLRIPQYQNWFVCWNNDIKEYVTVYPDYPDSSEADKIKKELDIDTDDDAGVAVFGGKYVSLYFHDGIDYNKPEIRFNPYMEIDQLSIPESYVTYIYEDGKYTKSLDDRGFSVIISARPGIDNFYLTDLDIDAAAKNLIPLE